MTTTTLREEIKESIQQNFDPDFVYVIVDEILKIFEKRINSVKVDHTPVGECPECDSKMLKQFMEMLK